MSRCTTSSSNLRPMRRLMANSVFCGLVTAWRLAGWPTSTSPSLVNATIEGVVRSPSLFSITRGLPPSMMATHELVVPRSIPITFAMSALRARVYQNGDGLGPLRRGGFRGFQGTLGLLRYDNPRRAQQSPVQLVAGLDHVQDRIGLGGRRGLGHHGLVPAGVEGLTLGVDELDPELVQGLGQERKRRLSTLLEAGRVGGRRVGDRELEAVLHRQQLPGELLQPPAVGRLDVALGALPDVLQLRHGAQVLLPVALGPFFGLGERLLQTLEFHQL